MGKRAREDYSNSVEGLLDASGATVTVVRVMESEYWKRRMEQRRTGVGCHLDVELYLGM